MFIVVKTCREIIQHLVRYVPWSVLAWMETNFFCVCFCLKLFKSFEPFWVYLLPDVNEHAWVPWICKARHSIVIHTSFTFVMLAMPPRSRRGSLSAMDPVVVLGHENRRVYLLACWSFFLALRTFSFLFCFASLYVQPAFFLFFFFFFYSFQSFCFSAKPLRRSIILPVAQNRVKNNADHLDGQEFLTSYFPGSINRGKKRWN